MAVRKLMLLGAALLVLSSCGVRERFASGASTQAAGLPYRSTLARGDDRRDFQVTVRAVGPTVEEMRESVRFPATKYCIRFYGGSDIDWLVNPDTGDWSFATDADGTVFQGRCVTR